MPWIPESSDMEFFPEHDPIANPPRRRPRPRRLLALGLAVVAVVIGSWAASMRPWESPRPVRASVGIRPPRSVLGHDDVTAAYLKVAEEYDETYRAGRLKPIQDIYEKYRDRPDEAWLRPGVAETPNANALKAGSLRDELAILEEMTRRLGVIVEEMKVDLLGPPTVYLVHAAPPPRIERVEPAPRPD